MPPSQLTSPSTTFVRQVPQTPARQSDGISRPLLSAASNSVWPLAAGTLRFSVVRKVATLGIGLALRGARRELDDRTAPLAGLVAIALSPDGRTLITMRNTLAETLEVQAFDHEPDARLQDLQTQVPALEDQRRTAQHLSCP